MALDPYEVLGVGPAATDEELRAAWRAAVRALHPDTRAEDVPAAEADAALRLVNDAWAVVGDPSRRRRYDDGGLENWRSSADDDGEWTYPTHSTRLVRFPWWIVALAVLLVIFVFTAYAGAPAGPVR